MVVLIVVVVVVFVVVIAAVVVLVVVVAAAATTTKAAAVAATTTEATTAVLYNVFYIIKSCVPPVSNLFPLIRRKCFYIGNENVSNFNLESILFEQQTDPKSPSFGKGIVKNATQKGMWIRSTLTTAVNLVTIAVNS